MIETRPFGLGVNWWSAVTFMQTQSEDSWTEDEDFHLKEGYAICGGNFQRILDLFPFKSNRDANSLHRRWEDIHTSQDSEEKDIRQKFLANSGRFPKTTWDFTEEPDIKADPTPFVGEYEKVQSLAQKIEEHQTTIAAARPASKKISSSFNEMCLNVRFDAAMVKTVVDRVLAETVENEPLRETLSLELKRALIVSGRKKALEDLAYRITEICHMKDQTMAENESKILGAHADSILMFLAQCTRIQPPHDVMSILPSVLKFIIEVQRIMEQTVPVEQMPQCLKQVKEKFHSKFMETAQQIIVNFGNDIPVLHNIKFFILHYLPMDQGMTLELRLPLLSQNFIKQLRLAPRS